MAKVNRPIRSATPTLLLIVLGMFTALTLTQCKPIADQVTGTAASANANQCVTGCTRTYNELVRVESTLHVKNVQDCNGDATCLALEDARHDAAMASIQANRDNCINSCHHQGGGTGGN